MFEIIKSIIDHVWNTNSTGDQQIIYYICAIVIPLCIVLVWDAICCIFRSFTRFK